MASAAGLVLDDGEELEASERTRTASGSDGCMVCVKCGAFVVCAEGCDGCVPKVAADAADSADAACVSGDGIGCALAPPTLAPPTLAPPTLSSMSDGQDVSRASSIPPLSGE